MIGVGLASNGNALDGATPTKKPQETSTAAAIVLIDGIQRVWIDETSIVKGN